MTRDVYPGVEGMMQHLVLSPDNRYAAAFTTNYQVGFICEVQPLICIDEGTKSTRRVRKISQTCAHL